MSAPRYIGEVVFIYAFDLGYEMTEVKIERLFGQPLAPFAMDLSRRNPKHLALYRPQTLLLPAVERTGPQGLIKVGRCIKLFPVGAISICYRVPFAVDQLDDLITYHDLQFREGALHDEVVKLTQDARTELLPYLVRPVPQLADEEAYTVFCLHAPAHDSLSKPITGESWLAENRLRIASLLTQETEVARLSNQEAEESTSKHLSYYENDLVVIDWDAALILDEPQDFEEALYIMEMANLQLAELEAYDKLLDAALVRSYRDVRGRMGNRRELLANLQEIQIDLARFNDEISNITKFFGDWHLARIYQNVSARFHLPDWHKSIDDKLKTLDDLYQMLIREKNHRWMLVLEVTIVLLFILDLILIVTGIGK